MNIREISTAAKSVMSGLLPEREVDTVLSILFEFRLGWNRTQQIIRREDMLDPDMIDILNDDIQQISIGRPVQHITGIGWFLDMPFKVNGDVLIPRPETEELVLAAIRSLAGKKNPVVLDVCTGSGCIAIAIKKQLPQASVRAIDVSEKALEIAGENEINLLGKASVIWQQADVLTHFQLKGDEDLIISNPPYIPLQELNDLPVNVRNYEPHLALFTPYDDPLIFYQVIARQFAELAKPDAQLWFECHENYIQQVEQLIGNAGFREILIHRDMQGKQRMLQVLEKTK